MKNSAKRTSDFSGQYRCIYSLDLCNTNIKLISQQAAKLINFGHGSEINSIRFSEARNYYCSNTKDKFDAYLCIEKLTSIKDQLSHASLLSVRHSGKINCLLNFLETTVPTV